MTLEQDVYLRGRPFLTPEPKPDRNPRPPSGRPGVRPVRIHLYSVRPYVSVSPPSAVRLVFSPIVKVAVGGVEREIATVTIIPKLKGAGDMFSDYLCVDCANLPCLSGHNLFKITNNNQTYY